MLEGDVYKLSTSSFATLGWTELKAQCSFNQLLLLKQHLVNGFPHKKVIFLRWSCHPQTSTLEMTCLVVSN